MKLKETLLIILISIAIMAGIILLVTPFFKPVSADESTVPEDLELVEGYSEIEGFTSESGTEPEEEKIETEHSPSPDETKETDASADETSTASEVYSGQSETIVGVDTSLFTPDKYPKTEGCEQFLLLKSVDYNGILFFYEKDNGVWKLVSMCTATLGKKGVTEDKMEGDGCTPVGEFPLLFVMAVSKPITEMRYERLVSGSIWVDDTESPYYNTLAHEQSTNSKNWKSYEKLYDRYFKGGTHKNMIYVGYNGDGLTAGTAESGKGSMITICGKTESLEPTGGCIDILDTDMTRLLQYLKPGKKPVIMIE